MEHNLCQKKLLQLFTRRLWSRTFESLLVVVAVAVIFALLGPKDNKCISYKAKHSLECTTVKHYP